MAIEKTDEALVMKQREIMEEINHLPHGGKKSLIYTLGCQQNESDSEKLSGMLKKMGYTPTENPEEADVILFNTCAVRENAEKKLFGRVGALKPLKEKNPELLLGVCGCMAQEAGMEEKFRRRYRFVDMVFGTHALYRFPEILKKALSERTQVRDVSDIDGEVTEGIPVDRASSVKSYVSVMYGCNNFCSYCIVPYVRGRERSRKPEKILEEIRALAADGCREIMLLGQNVNSYGRNLEEDINFPELLRRIDALDGDFRVRFMSPHPKDATEELFDVMANSRKICRSIHLPLQSGSNRILKEMNRRYTAEKYMEIVECARKKMPGLSITTDIIVGFPNETYEDFQETMKIVRAVKYDNIFSFIYSKRSGTKAALMEDKTSEEDKGKWFRELLAAQREISDEHYKRFLGAEFEVLFESVYKDGLISGKSGEFIITLVNGDESLIGTMHRVRVTKTHNWAVEGEIID